MLDGICYLFTKSHKKCSKRLFFFSNAWIWFLRHFDLRIGINLRVTSENGYRFIFRSLGLKMHRSRFAALKMC